VQKYLGNYDSTESGDRIQLTLDGHRPILTASGDLLDLGCDSAIGALKTLTVRGEKDSEALATASFELNTSLCSNPVWGKTIDLTFQKSNSNSVKVTVLSRLNYEQRCELVPPQGGQVCHWDERPVYESATFQKK
jgi:hypothetical protein